MNRRPLRGAGWYSGTGWLVANGGNYPTRRSAVFITGDDYMRLALQAYYAALRTMIPPEGEGWLSDAGCGRLVPWSSAEDLFDRVQGELCERLRIHARTTGHYWDADEVAAGHGDASPAPGTPACALQLVHPNGDRSRDTTPESPLLLCPDGQGLPASTEGPNVNGANGPEVHHAG